jgi:hypothetical protein
MTINLGAVPASSTIYIPFNTYDANGASVTITGLATSDILVYKNGSTTERSSTAGFTLLDTDGIDFDGKTGIHGFSIDLSNNTDAGFYAAGAFYWVVVSTVTANAQTVSFVAATFRIVAAETTAGTPNVTTADVTTAGVDAILDRAAGVETNRTLRQSLRLILAVLCGKASGLATTTAVYRDTNDSKDRISATVDADGNRSAVTLDAT